MRASVVLTEVGQGLRRNIGLTVAVVLTVLVAGVLGGLSLMLHKQVDTMKDYWYDKVEVSIYLCSAQSQTPSCQNADVTNDQRNQIAADLTSNALVQNFYHESKEEAYAHFKEQFRNNPDIVNSVSADALPESFRVKLKNPSQYTEIASEFEGRPGVEQVQDSRAIFDKIFSILNSFQLASLVISVIMVIAALLLIANTIRVAAFTRRRETGIMRLVGASNLSIRLPFVLETMMSAFLGAVLAVAMMFAFKALLIDRVLEPTFRITNFIGWGDVFVAGVWVMVIALVFAALASTITLRRYLRV
ncbi:MAG: permease-like cell division protein FtsX [Actinomycetes bacterium]